MDWFRALRQIVALATVLALALLAPPALADAPAAGGAMDHHVAAPMDCCPGETPDQAPDPADCQPGMTCHASPAAVVAPALASEAAAATRISYGPASDDLVDSRPPEGLLRPPRASVSC